ncbi:MAG TPA: hypothetical protein VK586_04990 [Streptosporangiaceae bacterium]|nr:hypothetical protein [Streptosporangiaceae bacterium]
MKYQALGWGRSEASESYRAALDLAPTEAERRFLRSRLRQVGDAT